MHLPESARPARPVPARVKIAVLGVGLALVAGRATTCGIPLDTAPRDLPTAPQTGLGR